LAAFVFSFGAILLQPISQSRLKDVPYVLSEIHISNEALTLVLGIMLGILAGFFIFRKRPTSKKKK